MIGTTHLFRQRNDEPFLDLHLFQCTCIIVINVKKRIPNCTVNICNMYIEKDVNLGMARHYAV